MHNYKKHTQKTKDKISKAVRRYRLGRKHSIETRLKMKKSHKFSSHKGENHWSWKGGVTPLRDKIRKCFEYRQWRSDVFTRDNFVCNECNNRGLRLHAHHVKSFSKICEENNIITLEQAKMCEELWNINNGITLCIDCHKKTDTYGVRNIK